MTGGGGGAGAVSGSLGVIVRVTVGLAMGILRFVRSGWPTRFVCSG
jgi:hypothetical protein